MQSASTRDWFQQNGKILFWVLAPVLLWHMYRYEWLIPLTESVTMATMMACTGLAPESFPARCLEWKHLKFLGLISYSLYVWQQAVLFISTPWIGALFLPLVAILSYGLVEQPCITLGRRVTRLLRFSEPALSGATR